MFVCDINVRFVLMCFADRPVWLRGASGAPQQTSGLWLPPQRASVTSTSSDCYSCASVGLNDASDHDFQRGEHHTRSFIYFSLQLTLSNATQTRFLSRLLGWQKSQRDVRMSMRWRLHVRFSDNMTYGLFVVPVHSNHSKSTSLTLFPNAINGFLNIFLATRTLWTKKILTID